MKNIRDEMKRRLFNLIVKIDSKLLASLSDQLASKLDFDIHDKLYNACQNDIGNHIELNIKLEMYELI